MKKIAIADDHSILLNFMTEFLNKQEKLKVIGSFTGGNKLLNEIEKGLLPDVIILDLFMEDGDGFLVIDEVKKLEKDIKIIVITFNKEPGLIEQILRNGVDAVINKASEDYELTRAIDTILEGEKFLCPINQEIIDEKNNSYREVIENEALTNRERQVLKLICEGKTNSEIAEILFISEKTVKTHRKNILNKLGVNSPISLMRVAIKLGYVTV